MKTIKNIIKYFFLFSLFNYINYINYLIILFRKLRSYLFEKFSSWILSKINNSIKFYFHLILSIDSF